MKKIYLFQISLALVMLFAFNNAFSQGTAINAAGTTADSSAILDVSSSTQGLLIPRMTEAQKNAVPRPATGLLIYQLDGTQPGYYFNAGDKTTKNWMYIGGDDLGNHTASDSLDMSLKKIVNLALCTDNYDAANKLYVDNIVGAGGGGGHYLGEDFEGGKIFWIDGSGQHGLIARTTDDYGDIAWSNIVSEIGPQAQYYDNGALNTAAAVSQPGCNAGAVYVCDTLTANSYTDWYLPSPNELRILIENMQYVGNFRLFDYWTSQELTANYARYFLVYNYDNVMWDISYTNKSNAYNKVRCIRKF